MDSTNAATVIDAALVSAASAYASWLWDHKKYEPDWIWTGVVAGAAGCLVAAGLQSRIAGGDWRDHERRVWRAFALGGVPIIVGEIAQWLVQRDQRQRYLRQRQ